MKRSFVLLSLLLTATPASAHVGVESIAGFPAGFGHPLSGLDHVTAMIAVGLWAALKERRAQWMWPAAFVSTMLVGGALGMAHVPIPLVEPGVLASVVVFGLLVAIAADLPVSAGVAIISVFAILHGHAHGTEVAGMVSGIEYMAGLAVATALLHAVGIAAAALLGVRHRNLVRIGGAACVAIGVGLIAGVP
jgi:urease accessory protein